MTETDHLRVVVLDDYQRVAEVMGAWATIPAEVEVITIDRHLAELDDLVAAVGDADVVVAMRERTPLTAAFFEAVPNLRLVVTTGPSNAVIDVGAANRHGVEVRGTGGYLSTTAEHTWALILALLRHIPASDRAVREGGWQHTLGTELAGRVLGVVGLGRLGTAVTRVAHAFDMDVIAWSPNLDPATAEGLGVRPVSRDELFATADVVTIHMVLSERSRGLVGAHEIGLMKPTAVLVNSSRGPLVDEDALVDALEAGRIAGAALDVFHTEPLPADHPLRRLDNTVLTPHTGYVSDGLYRLFYDEIVEDIAAWCRGEPLRVVVP
ncbi:MAG: D-2-hydroxyacid dehydrogenase family protein [Acidimicrobiales bacterium]